MRAAFKSIVSSAWFDQLFPPDPGALRLLAALRATLSGTLTFFFVTLLGVVFVVPIADRILGFAIGLFIAATTPSGGNRRQQLITIAFAPLSAFLAAALAAVLIDAPIAAAIAVPPLMFVVAYGAARGPRYGSLGMVALIAYIVSLVTRLSPDTLPMRLVVLISAAASAALVRFVLLPERPQTELDRLRRAVHITIARVLDQIAAAVGAGAWTDRMRAGLRRDVQRFGDVVMLAQARVSVLAAQLPANENLGARWLHLLEIELATERLSRVALRDLGSSEDSAELLAGLQALKDGAEWTPDRSAGPLAAALGLLDHVLRETPQTAPSLAAAQGPVSVPSLRPALQTAIAAALAVVLGDLVSPNRWYWAAFSAFVMFQGTRSRSESIAKGVQFMIGTLAGVFVGMLLATLLSGHEILSLVAIIVAVFLAFQANVAAYGAMIFWITIILGLMFGMLGYFTPDLLLLRLKEAAVGAACGALVASAVFVRRDRDATRDAAAAFLRSLGRAVQSCASALIDGAPEPKLADYILAAERSSRDLNAIARAELSGHFASRNEALRRRLLVLDACEQWTRELGQICLSSVRLNDPTLVRSAREAATRIDCTLTRLIARLANQPMDPPIADEPAEDLNLATQDDLPNHAVRLLLRIDAALLHNASS